MKTETRNILELIYDFLFLTIFALILIGLGLIIRQNNLLSRKTEVVKVGRAYRICLPAKSSKWEKITSWKKQ